MPPTTFFPGFRQRGVGFQFRWAPDPDIFATAIETVAEDLRDRTLPLMVASQELRADIRERFVTETNPDGSPWQQWAGTSFETGASNMFGMSAHGYAYNEGYAVYAENYPNIGILRQDGDLFGAAISEDRVRISNDSVFYSAAGLPSAGMAHQEGAPHRRTKSGTPNPLAQRSFIGMSNKLSAGVMAIFGEWFDRSISLFVTPTGKIGRRWMGPEGTRSSIGTFLPRD